MSKALEGKIAVVTGASSGIGRTIAVALGREGAKIVLGGRTEGLLRETAREIEAAGSKALVRVLDVRRETELKRLVQAAVSSFGVLDIMVNNAGVGFRSAVIDGDTERWREMLETNALALFVGCREAARVMADRGGQIVNISSLAGRQSTPGDAVYCATKHAVNAFSESFRGELQGSGIRLIVVEPGQVLTSFGRTLTREQLTEVIAALGLDSEVTEAFAEGHLSPTLAEKILRSHRDLFLAPEDVARAVIKALSAPEEGSPPVITIQPGD